MDQLTYVPHIELLLQAFRISRERLDSHSKVAVSVPLLKHLLQVIARNEPFDEAFYRTTYADIARAHEAGNISDLRSHFAETGYFEGRFGARPPVDEASYIEAYPDVARAVQNGTIESATEHYLRSGAAEGRIPNPHMRSEVERWKAVLQS